MDNERFLRAVDTVTHGERERGGIGEYAECSLHAVLKEYYEPCKDRRELRVGRFCADIVGEDGIIEIQTRQLFKMKKKIAAFLEISPVTVVYPVAAVKYIAWRDRETGEISDRRKSPRKGTVYDALYELYSLKEFIANPGFSFIVILLEIDEYKDLDGWSRDKKKGAHRFERIPRKIFAEECFASVDDYRRFVPDGLPNGFNSADFAKKAHISRPSAQLALNLLTAVGAVSRIDRDKNGFLYSTVK